jgi:CubicO group peptidase (beta-lactamase class C family)
VIQAPNLKLQLPATVLFVALLIVESADGKNQRRRVALTPALKPASLSENAREPSFAALDALLDRTSSNSGPLALLMTRDGRVIYSRGFRGGGSDTRYAIASCSKWLIASTVMTLVDDGLVGLDDPVGKYLESFDGTKETMTIRHLLSHTSGLPSRLKKGTTRMADLDRAVDRLGRHTPLTSAPGDRFCYGNLSFQVAARIVEVVTGQPLHRVFEARIAAPCGMRETRFPAAGLGRGINQASSTVTDFASFLEMFKNGGVAADGTRVLSTSAVEEMKRNQTRGKEMGCVNRMQHRRMGRLEYGLGLWRERVDPVTQEPTAISHFGTAGFRGVINYRQDYIMVLGIKGKVVKKKRYLTQRFMETLDIIDHLDFTDR